MFNKKEINIIIYVLLFLTALFIALSYVNKLFIYFFIFTIILICICFIINLFFNKTLIKEEMQEDFNIYLAEKINKKIFNKEILENKELINKEFKKFIKKDILKNYFIILIFIGIIICLISCVIFV